MQRVLRFLVVAGGFSVENNNLRELNTSIESGQEKIDTLGAVASSGSLQSKVAEASRENLPTHVANNINKKLDNPDELKKSFESSEEKDPNKRDLKDEFLNALSLFLPQIGGMVLGGAIGGVEGAVAGNVEGRKATQLLIDTGYIQTPDNMLKMQRLQNQQAPKTSLSAQWIDKNTGEPVYSRQNPVTGMPELVDTKGNVRDASSVVSKDIALQNMRDADVNSRFNTKVKMDEQRLALQKGGIVNRIAGDFRDKVVKDDVELLRNVDKLDSMIDSNTPFTGIIDQLLAKGIAGEKGPLAEQERKVLSEVVGWRGQLSGLEEYMKGNISNIRKDAAKQLVNILRPKLQNRVFKAATSVSKAKAKTFGMDENELRDNIIQSLGAPDGLDSTSKPAPSEDKLKRLEALRSKLKK